MTLAPGALIGPYEITAPLGVGGMGEVYRATDTNLKRQVAIKRDGRFLVFHASNAKTSMDVWALPLTGDKTPFPLVRTDHTEAQGQLSPDGRWLAYPSNESGVSQVYVQPFAPGWETPITGKWQISTTGGTQPRWRGDGKEMFYVEPDRKLMAVDLRADAKSLDRGTPQPLFDSRADVGGFVSSGYAPSADGQRFLMPVRQGADADLTAITVVVNWLATVTR